jgi:acetate kinase
MGNGVPSPPSREGNPWTPAWIQPFPGVIMGTRSGDVDTLLISFLSDQEGIDNKAMSHVLNRKADFWEFPA